MNHISTKIFIAFITSMVFFASASAQINPPTTPPPGGNVFPPINTSSTNQTKTGGIAANFFVGERGLFRFTGLSTVIPQIIFEAGKGTLGGMTKGIKVNTLGDFFVLDGGAGSPVGKVLTAGAGGQATWQSLPSVTPLVPGAVGGTLPPGQNLQTLRFDGTNWVANNTLWNDGNGGVQIGETGSFTQNTMGSNINLNIIGKRPYGLNVSDDVGKSRLRVMTKTTNPSGLGKGVIIGDLTSGGVPENFVVLDDFLYPLKGNLTPNQKAVRQGEVLTLTNAQTGEAQWAPIPTSANIDTIPSTQMIWNKRKCSSASNCTMYCPVSHPFPVSGGGSLTDNRKMQKNRPNPANPPYTGWYVEFEGKPNENANTSVWILCSK